MQYEVHLSVVIMRDLTYDFILQRIIKSILDSGRLGPNIMFLECYGLLLKHLKSDEVHWLHPNLTVAEVELKYEQQHVEAEWRFVCVCVSHTTESKGNL